MSSKTKSESPQANKTHWQASRPQSQQEKTQKKKKKKKKKKEV